MTRVPDIVMSVWVPREPGLVAGTAAVAFSLPTNGAASAKAVMMIKSRKPKFNCKGDHISKSGYKGLGWQG